MGLSPNEIAQSTIGRLAAATNGFIKSKGGGEDASVPTDEQFERYQEAKATHGIAAKEVSLTELIGKVKVKPGK